MTTAAKRKRRDAPTPDEVKAARIAAGLNQTEAAEVVYVRQASWSRWEAGVDVMHPLVWMFFRLRVEGVWPKMPAQSPLGSEVRAARLAAGLTQEAAAQMLYLSDNAWSLYEARRDERVMRPLMWQVFLIKTGQLRDFGRAAQK